MGRNRTTRKYLIRDFKFLTTLPDAPTRAYGEKLLHAVKAMFKVIHRHETLTPQAFQAALEQAIRFIVIDRLVTQGTRGPKGQRADERLWTVIATCALQGRSAFAFILQVRTSGFHGYPQVSRTLYHATWRAAPTDAILGVKIALKDRPPILRAVSFIVMYSFLDFFLATVHGGLIVFNLTGWLWTRTRRLHLMTIGLTILFWFGAGAFYGWGYCPLTDWHWQIKTRLGETGLPASYIKYYADRITGWNTNALLIDASVVVLGSSALALSLWVNWQDWRSRRNSLV